MTMLKDNGGICMVGRYKYISKYGDEKSIDTSAVQSDKDIYNLFYKEKNTHVNINNNFNIDSINDAPIYNGKALEYFNYIKKVIEKKLRDNLSIEEIRTPSVLKNNKRLAELQKLFGLQEFKCNDEYILVPASDFGVFSLFENRKLKQNQLPIRLYEFAKCYRIEEKRRTL